MTFSPVDDKDPRNVGCVGSSPADVGPGYYEDCSTSSSNCTDSMLEPR